MGAIIPERMAAEIDGGTVARQAGPAIDGMAVKGQYGRHGHSAVHGFLHAADSRQSR